MSGMPCQTTVKLEDTNSGVPSQIADKLEGATDTESGMPRLTIVKPKWVLGKSHHDYLHGKKGGNNSTAKSLQDDSGTVSIPLENFTNTYGSSEREGPTPILMNTVSWPGCILKIEDQKAFHHSCCINGLVYKVKDHVLVNFKNRLIPSKLEAMWEDINNKTKWVTVNPYYFPSDLPKTLGRPFQLDWSEVYGSMISCNVMAGFIQGPCEVLPPNEFLKEKERRANAGKKRKPNEPLHPLFLCKWIYDESKVLFRDVIIC